MIKRLRKWLLDPSVNNHSEGIPSRPLNTKNIRLMKDVKLMEETILFNFNGSCEDNLKISFREITHPTKVYRCYIRCNDYYIAVLFDDDDSTEQRIHIARESINAINNKLVEKKENN